MEIIKIPTSQGYYEDLKRQFLKLRRTSGILCTVSTQSTFSSVQSLSCVRLFAAPWTSAQGFPVQHQLLELTQTHVHQVGDNHPTISSSVIPISPWLQSFPASGSFLMSQFFPSGGQKYWSFSFSISPSNEYSRLISFRIDWFGLLESPRDSQESSSTTQFKSINSSAPQLSLWSNSHIHTWLQKKS